MKLFGNWFGFIAIATGATNFIFAIVDSNSIPTDKSPPNTKGRASYIWEKRISPPYPYQQQHHYKTLVTPHAFTGTLSH